MSIGREFHCDGPDCEVHTGAIATPAPYLPYGFLEVRQTLPGADEEALHFHCWDCLMKYAAGQPIPERIEP